MGRQDIELHISNSDYYVARLKEAVDFLEQHHHFLAALTLKEEIDKKLKVNELLKEGNGVES